MPDGSLRYAPASRRPPTAVSFITPATQLGNFGNISQDPWDYVWALVKYPLTVSYIEGYGFWTLGRYLIGADAQTIDSTYRPPAYNKLKVKGAASSRHQFGDAVDIANVSHSQPEHDTKACWAGIQAAIAAGVVSCSNGQDAGADWVKEVGGAPGSTCLSLREAVGHCRTRCCSKPCCRRGARRAWPISALPRSTLSFSESTNRTHWIRQACRSASAEERRSRWATASKGPRCCAPTRTVESAIRGAGYGRTT